MKMLWKLTDNIKYEECEVRDSCFVCTVIFFILRCVWCFLRLGLCVFVIFQFLTVTHLFKECSDAI